MFFLLLHYIIFIKTKVFRLILWMPTQRATKTLYITDPMQFEVFNEQVAQRSKAMHLNARGISMQEASLQSLVRIQVASHPAMGGTQLAVIVNTNLFFTDLPC
jgi:hypothetical protein